jgi:hypothetical protein
MKRKDKGKNTQQQKQEEIHRKNCYMKRIRSMMGILGDESAYDLLGPKGVLLLYLTRLRPVKLVLAETSNLKATKKDLVRMNEILTRMLCSYFVGIGPEEKQVSIYDFMCYTETIFQYWRNVDKEDCLNPEAFKEKLSFFNDFEALRMNAHLKKDDCVQLMTWIFNRLGDYTVRIKPEDSKAAKSPFSQKTFYNNFVVSFEKPETELFEIDGHKRTVFQINIYNENKVSGITITPEQLGIKGLLKDLPLKVYIQRHALDRIKERIGDYFTDFNYTEIISLVLKPQTFPADGGGYLFPYTYMNKRLGYLKANIFGDRLIFRTFLFLTNNGTPEGKKLAKLLGVQKADKKYLGIDNLKTFINSDIESNENLKRIFCQTGCSELFELKTIMRKNPSPTIHCANFIEKYLGLKQEEEVITQVCPEATTL